MMTITLIFLIISLINQSNTNAIYGSGTTLYDPLKDDVELLNKTSFDSIYKSDRAVFVEFYAHWCGACQRYAQHWKQLAKETKSWHAKVIRVAAINCADQENDSICREFNIEFYPTLKLFSAQATKGIQPAAMRSDKVDSLITKMILFIENHEHKPHQWPELEAYTSKRLDTLFLSPYHNCKYAFLIIEKSDSDEFGRKLILDFSEFTDRIALRRVVSNQGLLNKLELDVRSKPAIYLVNNTRTNGMKPIEVFTKQLVDRYAKHLNKFNHDLINADDSLNDDDLKSLSDRERYSRLIRYFIKITDLITKDELDSLNSNVNAAQVHAEEVNKAEAQSYLTSMDNRIFMHDLESGLNLMLRNDISRSKLITGEKLNALKEWLRVLVKFYPGRKPVRNYLKHLYSKVNKTNEITGTQWKLFTDESLPNAYLPNIIEWKHCLGSQTKYRGYPCSLWTLFHVLSVSQTDLEKAKPRPFTDDYSTTEVIEAIRLFVFNFFMCRECADNFKMETENYIKYLIKPYDPVQYLWTVHNNVNKRLTNDESTDPSHPKIQFPSQQQCPKCYLPNVNINDLKDHESPWITNEVLLFLTSFYSKLQIEGIRDLDERDSNRTFILNEPTAKFYDYDYDKKQIDTSDNIINNNNNNNQKLKRKAKRLTGLEGFVDLDSGSASSLQLANQSSSILKSNLVLFCLILFVLVFVYLYFNMSKRKLKLKKHLI